jgi:anti-sigma-K factor RskA
LESLTSEERTAYLNHLELCRICRQLVNQFQEVAELLPDALEEEAPLPSLKERVLAQAAADVAGEARRSPSLLLEERPSRAGWRWFNWLAPVPAGAIATLVLALIGLIAWNVYLSLSVNHQARILVEQSRLLEAIAAGAVVHHIPGTDLAPGARAVLVQEPGSENAFLMVQGLSDLPSNMVYQVWHIGGEGAAPMGAGTFSVTDPDGQLITVPADFSNAEALGISIEPRGGSPAPTGDIVLMGEL